MAQACPPINDIPRLHQHRLLADPSGVRIDHARSPQYSLGIGEVCSPRRSSTDSLPR